VVGAIWYSGGPASPGWASRAGTPKRLLAAPVHQVVDRPLAHTVVDVPTPPFSARLAGTLTTSDQPGGLVRVDIRGRTNGGAATLLWIRLRGQPTIDGGVQLTASGVRFGTRSDPNLYVGSVHELAGTQLGMVVHNASGRRIRLDVALRIDQATGRIAGVLHARPGPGGSQ